MKWNDKQPRGSALGRLIVGTVFLAGVGGVVMADDPRAEDKKAAAAKELETFAGV